MDENQIKLKSINDLLSCDFFIPSYQRGYRWEKRQIIELLDDINDFKDNKKGREFYCLQPRIVKKEEDYYKLIDGQQRLTTIYIILSYLNRKKFTIQFETRERSKEFLEKVKPLNEKLDLMDTCDGDYYYDEYRRLEDKVAALEEEYLHDLQKNYRIMLQKEYEYLTSEKHIIETIKMNEWEFTENGTMI